MTTTTETRLQPAVAQHSADAPVAGEMRNSEAVDSNGLSRRSVSWQSPIGPLRIVATSAHITGLYMQNHTPAPLPSMLGNTTSLADTPEVVQLAIEELTEYFSGKRQSFTFARQIVGGTHFQRAVWQALADIPYGATATYGEIAAQIGRPQAVRAVGAAVARNPISIVIPCHRVVGAGGNLTGYAGGVERKAYLLQLEDEHADIIHAC